MSALILSGGGARGAYEAGVLRYVYGPLAARLGKDLAPDVICGTSVGALTGAWVAAQGMQAAATLSYFWRELEPHHIYKMRIRDLVSGRDAWLQRRTALGGGTALFDPSPLYEHVRTTIPWQQMYERIDSGALRAFACAATDVASGKCIQFTDGLAHTHVRPPGLAGDSLRETATTTMRAARIAPEHVLASAAIPFVFPPVSVKGRWMVDGALRQNTPLGPALQLQSDRMLVIGVKRQKPVSAVAAPPQGFGPPPTAATIAGRALNALMLDPVEEDLRRIERWNAMLTWAEGAYPGFLDRLEAEHRAYRVVKSVHLRPSEDIGRIAARLYPVIGPSLSWASRLFFEGIVDDTEADLVSYFLFHKRYTRELEELGYADAEAAEQAIGDLLG